MAIETVRVLFPRAEGPSALLNGVTVRVFDKDTNLITMAESGRTAVGVAEFDVEGSPEGTEYQLRSFMAGTRIPVRRIRVYSPPENAPSTSNDFLIPVEAFTLPAATDPTMCRASGYLLGPARTPRRNTTITFLPKFDAFVDQISVSTPGRFTINTDDKGYAVVDLYRFGLYEVTVEGREAFTRTIQVPARPSILLPHLLFPVVVSVAYKEPGPFVVRAGETLWLTPNVVATDYRDLGAGFEDVLYQVEDPSIANAQPMGDRIAVRGIKPGTTALQADRRDRSIVYLPDYGIEGGVVSIYVTA